MEISVIVGIIEWVIPTAIAVASLLYAAKQRNVVKREILKKRYLENALSNLNEAIKSLKKISVPSISTLSYDLDDAWGDYYRDAYTLVSEILRASFELKKKKIVIDVSYSMTGLRETDKSESDKEERKRNFDDLEPKWFVDYLRSRKGGWRICSETEIPDFERWLGNELELDMFRWDVNTLLVAIEQLSNFDEVYETVSPNTVMKAKQLFEEIAEAIFSTAAESKRIEIDLDKFSKAGEVIKYLYEKILNYSHIAEKFSRVSDLISELGETRKELFLKIP
jgi:hypothetical protein